MASAGGQKWEKVGGAEERDVRTAAKTNIPKRPFGCLK